MDTSPSPYDMDPRDLALLCDRRAHELQARAWRTEAERDALRVATADLLAAVARQLAPGVPSSSADAALSDEELRSLIATQVVHQPLHPTDPQERP